MAPDKNDFDIAKSIHNLLEPVSEDRRYRILRWVAESLDVALNVKHTSTGHTPRQSAGEKLATPTTHPQTESSGRTQDIKSFVDAKSPKNDVQYATVVAYFYRFELPQDDRSETITSNVLQDSTRLAGRARLSNPGTTLNNAKNLGYLDGVARGEFQINTVGENLVAMTLPSDGSTTPRKTSTKKKPPKKKKGNRKKKSIKKRS